MIQSNRVREATYLARSLKGYEPATSKSRQRPVKGIKEGVRTGSQLRHLDLLEQAQRFFETLWKERVATIASVQPIRPNLRSCRVTARALQA